VLVAVLTASLTVAGCGIPLASQPTRIPRADVPFHLLSPTTPTTPTSTTTGSAGPVVGAREQVYLVDTTQHVIGVIRDVTPPARLTAVLGALLDGPTAAESAAGIQSFLTGQPADVTATVSNGVATVDFTTNPFQIVGPDQTLAVSQVVFTATAQPGVTGVLFEIAGKPIEVPTAAGVQVPGPVTDATYAAQAPVASAPTSTSG
jgi:hypothetical protein